MSAGWISGGSRSRRSRFRRSLSWGSSRVFFVFRGSYRLCDVDDLMLNTLGGLLGGELVHALEAYLPPLDAFDRFPGSALAMQRLG